jgi:hypothetical protein
MRSLSTWGWDAFEATVAVSIKISNGRMIPSGALACSRTASTDCDPLRESPARAVEVCTQVWLRCHPQDQQVPGSRGDNLNISHK